MLDLNGKWIYRSFRPGDFAHSLELWAPPGELSVTTDAAGRVEGLLRFPAVPGLVLTIEGSLTQGIAGKRPEGVELTGKGGLGSVNALRGYVVGESPVPLIAGTIVAVANDPGGRPDGTSGPFVLVRAD